MLPVIYIYKFRRTRNIYNAQIEKGNIHSYCRNTILYFYDLRDKFLQINY